MRAIPLIITLALVPAACTDRPLDGSTESTSSPGSTDGPGSTLNGKISGPFDAVYCNKIDLFILVE